MKFRIGQSKREGYI